VYCSLDDESSFSILLLISKANGFILHDKEYIILVPSVTFRDHSNISSTDWILYNLGWYYEEDLLPSKIMEKSLEKIIEKDLDFNRIELFTADGEEKKNLCIDNLN